MVDSVEKRIAKFAERYCTAYWALLDLDPTGDWQETFLELRSCDNRGPGKERDEEGVGDGNYFCSWIWLLNPRAVGPVDGDTEDVASEEDVNEVLRVDWTTSFARQERWTEEVELLQEEMRRVVVFLEWKSKAWLANLVREGAVEGGLAFDIQSGLDVYSRKQAAIYHNLAVSFAKLWRPTLISYGLKYSWATKFVTEHNTSPSNADAWQLPSRGIFKHRLAKTPSGTPSTVMLDPPALTKTTDVATDNDPLLELVKAHDEESDFSGSDSDWDPDSEDDFGLDW